MKTLLLVVDMQVGFRIPRTEHIVPSVVGLVGLAAGAGMPVACTRFINQPGSGYARWIHWTRFMGPPETDLIPELRAAGLRTFDKPGYTAFTDEFRRYLAENGIGRIAVCGVATDGCVLKTAVDAFEAGIEPVVIADACASHAGEEVHRAGLLLASRFIGKGQIRYMADAKEYLTAE